MQLIQLARKNWSTFVFLAWMTVLPLVVSSIVSYGVIRHEAIFSAFTLENWIVVGLVSCLTMGLALTPTSLMALLAGYFIGFSAFPGVIIAYTFASLVGFQLTHWMDRGALIRTLDQLPPKQALLAQQIREGIAANQFGLTALARMSPVLPFTMMNVLLSLAGVSLRNYLLGGGLGMLPRTFFLMWVGNQAQEIRFLVQNDGDVTTQLFLLGMVLFTLLGTGYYSKRIFNQQIKKGITQR